MSPVLRVPFCTKHRCYGTATAVQLGFKHRALRQTVRHRLQVLQVGNQADHFHQQIEIGLLLRRHVHEDRAAAPVFRHQTAIGELLLHAVRQSVRLVDLVHRDDHRNVRRFGVINGLQSLRHHTVIGGHDQHHDVGHLRSTRTHAGERFVTRRVKEHDLAAKSRRIGIGDRHFVRADVLRNSTGFASSNIGRADGVEQAGLAVVHVAHDGDHRRTYNSLGGTFFARTFRRNRVLGQLLLEGDNGCLGAEVTSHVGRQVGIERLVDGGEDASRQQAGDKVLGSNSQFLRQVFYADAFRNGDAPRDGQRLAGKRKPRRRNKALHRAFLHASRNIALSRTRRATGGTLSGRRWRGDACASSEPRTSAGRPGTGWMGTAALSWAHGRPRLSLRRHSRTRALEDRLATFWHTASRRNRSTGARRSHGRSQIHRTRSGLGNDQTAWRVRGGSRLSRTRR